MKEKVFELPEIFKGSGDVSGVIFTQIEFNKKEGYYVYERNDGVWEIFERRVIPLSGFRASAEKYKGYTHFVKYPSSSDFGKWAWCIIDKTLIPKIIKNRILLPKTVTTELIAD